MYDDVSSRGLESRPKEVRQGHRGPESDRSHHIPETLLVKHSSSKKLVMTDKLAYSIDSFSEA